MAKIINDSLITSKPNAPLDVRTEVATLADVVNISNPSESLVFKVLETGKYYKVDSLKTVKIEGTALTKKVVESFSSVGDVEDAPKDGGKYYRQNGVWVKVDESIDPALPILMINLKSDRGSDDTIERLKFTVKYASVVTELGSGQRINVPYGARLVVEFPSVEGYNKPDDIVVEDVSGNVVRNAVYEYTVTEVNVYVSAEDGTPVDGQIVTVEESYLPVSISNGVYIESTDGTLYTIDSWTGEEIANSAVVMSDDIKVKIPFYSKKITSGSEFESRKKGTNDISEALSDMDGENNSEYDGQSLGGAKNYVFPNGDVGAYIPSLGELSLIQKYWTDVVIAFAKVGVELNSSTIESSTPAANTGFSGFPLWEMNMLTGEASRTSYFTLIYVKKVLPEEVFKFKNRSEYEVLGGKASFTATKGNEVVVSLNKKEGDYGTPESVTFVADGTTKNISMMYAKLLIDTIYINNMNADTDSIISGEVNGKAIQAIWNNTKRCLGKIVINEKSEEELVLIEVDQNDNRYYKDGSLIDIEGLGTNAYYFTVIPSFSYKITQMQENIYKVEILYNYKQDEEGWKNFDKLVVPTFALSEYSSNNYRPIYYKKAETSYKVQHASNNLTCIKRFDIFDYSNIVLLILAKYGASRNWDNLEQISMGVYTEGDRIIALSGYSLRAGTKDAAFFAEGGLKKAYSFLGIENLLYRSLNLDVESFVDLHFNDIDSPGIQCNSDGTLTIRGNDNVFTTDFSYTESGTYVKSLIIRDYFFAIYEKLSSSSDLYYKDKTDKIESGKYYIVKNMFGVTGSTSSSGSVSHIKITCPCRVENEISNFNELENVWK